MRSWPVGLLRPLDGLANRGGDEDIVLDLAGVS